MKRLLYSFDVFDTLLMRRTATPRGIFALMQQKLLSAHEYSGLSPYVRENFFELRIHSEELARHQYQRHGVEDVTLGEIYAAMGTTGCLTAGELAELQQLEETTEAENSLGVERNIAVVREMLAAGERVVLISDMYLSAAVIRRLLVQADALFAALPLYVSSEYRLGKYTGNLFAAVRRMEKVDYADWQHTGDNDASDIRIPRALGIKAVYPRQMVPLLPVEKWVLGGRENDLDLQWRAGAARLSRMRRGVRSGPLAIGAAAAGPILYDYVRWFLTESLRRGFSRLYFIARDGYILQRMAEVIIAQEQLPIETFYIYGSRRAWRLPSYDGQQGSLLTMLKWAYPQKLRSVKDLAKLLQVSAAELLAFLPPEYQSAEAVLSFLTVSAVIRELDACAAFRRWYLAQQQEKRRLAVRYLRQEIDVSDDAFAFVELGGGGLTQSCLARLLAEFYSGRVKTFFFKMDSVNSWPEGEFYNFLPSYLASNLVIEMICRAAHGQTEGYTEQDGRVTPLLKEGEGEAIIAHGYPDYIEGILGFTEEYIGLWDQDKRQRFDLILRYMDYVALCPDRELLDFYADMPNSVTGIEKKVCGFAPKLSKHDMRQIFLLHGGEFYSWLYYPGTDLGYG